MKIFKTLLIIALAAGFLGAAEANKIVVDGSTTVGPIAKAFAEYYMKLNPGVNITVSESGSGNGAKSLVNQSCQVATMSRLLKLNEFEAAVHSEILPVVHVVALDGIAMIVHPGNPISKLTLNQVKDIYLGKVKNWNQLGGPNVPIVIISRDTNSGTYETFEGKVMKGDKIAKNCEYVGSNGAIRQRVQSTPAAIGYVGIGFIDSTVKALPIDGIMPSLETVKNGSYPIARPLYMVTNDYPKMGSHLYRFVTLYLSKKGQAIIEEIGFIPVTSY
ncbi:MAG: phosphate ABC transporter substrate-binding protein [Acidobacteria bacterium]|nr:phosphate ABC transporter substrate-binding protein [Acidobacteriota bacterium]MBU4307381.1 phosphate ABC transporter substrate-binding protein [Acidobacteriota bacterium]MCG2811628.1 phosphate ABC transporter substrate-binding protein [Candidatus Aminicenantes bacterium]